MCAIFGSSNFEKYQQLYKKGLSRGDHAYGSLMTEKECFVTIKKPGIADLTEEMAIKHDEREIKLNAFSFYLGHTQAPTSSKRTFEEATSHPFRCGKWIVAHNGVLTNYRTVIKAIKNKKSYNVVDSSVIPALLTQHDTEERSEIHTICDVLSMLKGTLGLWIYNTDSSNIYITRSGSTLFADFLTCDFSSVKAKGMFTLKEGELYLVTNEGLTSVGNFRPNSPFYII